jgi:glycerol-3-phosphate cytidylyltransferase
MFDQIEKAKTKGLKIGFTASTFDLLHPGHIAMLAEAKANCQFLVVGLLTDPTISRPEKEKPVQTMLERYIQIQAVRFVDMIVPFETEEELEQLLLTIMPDIRFIGEEYKNTNHTGREIEGITNYYNKRKHKFSSTDLRDRLRKTK